ncbi:hypothetical protein [Sessilibacter sp. MAH4]
MITVGSIEREAASEVFHFLSKRFKGRRKAIKEFTHHSPDFVFWIYPDGTLFDAKDAHRKNTPKGFHHILDDEPDYCGFLRGRLASNFGPQLLVVYCREAALSENSQQINQFIKGLSQLPVPLEDSALVISDNGDIYGTVKDVHGRITIT